MKLAYATAALVALALTLASCGGDDSSQESTSPAAGSTGQAGQTQTNAQADPGESTSSGKSEKSRNGNGGSSAADAQRAAGSEGGSKGGSSDASKPKQHKKKQANLTPAQELERLPGSERRALEHDLYTQGKDYCAVYGPKQVAQDNKLTATDPAAIAEQFARIREQALPALVLPFQQGCMAGFRKYARNPPKNAGS